MEELAALIDGRLEGDDRADLLAHVESCEACYEIYTETLRFREEEATSGDAEVASLSDRSHQSGQSRSKQRFWFAAGSLAAGALLAVVIWSPVGERFVGGLRGEGSLAVGNLIADLSVGQDEAAAHNAYDGSGWSRTRGLADHLNERERSFRLGVRVVDLTLALSAKDHSQAQQLLPEVVALSDGFDISEHVVATFREIQRLLEAGEDHEKALDLALIADGYATDLADRAAFELGKWAEAGRLAALSEEVAYFRRAKIRSLPSRLEGAKLYTELSGALDPLKAGLEVRPSAEHLASLADQFTRLVVEGGGTSLGWGAAP